MTDKHELARRGPVFAESERTIRPGELLVVDAHGRVLTRGERRGRGVAIGIALGVGLTLPLAAVGITGVTATLVVAATCALGLGLIRRYTMPFIRAQSRLTAGDLDGAEAALARLPSPARGMRARMRASLEAWIAYGRGRDQEAIRHFERGIALATGQGIRRAMLQIGLTDVLARSGDVARARQVRAAIAIEAPVSDLVTASLGGVDLAIAIADHAELALDETDIDRWVRLALELNNTTGLLAVLARVVATRGDDELADHLARESRDRFCWCPLESWPDLARWIDDRLAKLPAEST